MAINTLTDADCRRATPNDGKLRKLRKLCKRKANLPITHNSLVYFQRFC